MTRTTLKSTTPGAITGDAYMDDMAAHVLTFYNSSALRLTSIAGTADDPTAVVTPVLDVGLVAGMDFYFPAASTNTGVMTLVVGSETAKDISNADGVALVAGNIVSGTTYLLHYTGTEFIVMASGLVSDATGAALSTITITTTAAGNVIKPVDFPADGLVFIEAWGGGGGGSASATGAGGGGGAYNWRMFLGSDMGATETATIGGGGAVATGGGTTSVGTLLSAYGGAPSGGGGGGQLSAASGTPGGDPFGAASTASGGNAGAGAVGAGLSGSDGLFGGGGGGGSSTGATNGGLSLYGGGGGAGGGGTGIGGASAFGGAGGGPATGGAIPAGGGGGDSGTGGRGEVRVRWIG